MIRALRGRRGPTLALAEGLEGRALLSGGGMRTLLHPAAVDVGHARGSGPIQAASHHGAARSGATAARWRWLADTYWYVPRPNVSSVLLDTQDPTNPVLVPRADQTVFHLTGYRNGYFWGVSGSQFGSSTPIYSSMVGSVTPEGRVLILFSQMGSSSDPTITQGIGQMVKKAGQWTMENQMFTGSNAELQVGHWAYMTQTRPGLPSWRSLPVANVSVPQFLAGSPSQGPQPIGS